MSRINLLPPEVRQARRDAALGHQIRFFGVWMLVLLMGVFGVRTYEIFAVDREIADVESAATTARASLADLAEVAAARDAARDVGSLRGQLLGDSVVWSEQLLALADAVPVGFTLSSLSGQAGAGDTGLVGSLTFSATSRELVSTEVWLLRIQTQEGWANGWVSSVAAGEGGFSVSGSVDLTEAALLPRGAA